MKKRADSAPPKTGGDCQPSKGLIDELSTLEAMLEQRDRVDAEKKDSERASEDDQRE